MQYQELANFLVHVGKDPSKLIFEDELTGIHNRRFLLSYFKHSVRWDSDEDYPLSLLFLDLDHFKQVNDTHGHDVGDQVLAWVASILQEVGGDTGLPVRYGGDEFLLLLPRTDAAESRGFADKLKAIVAERSFRVRSSGTRLSLTFSIGIATAPQDGREGRALFRAADTALYQSKRSGRNQIASTEDVDLEKVFSKAALYRLEASGMVGRDRELAVVSQALEALARGKSQFVLLEGAPGSGKTWLLETVAANLAKPDQFCVCEVSGLEQEGYRSYYLATRILTELLNQRDDKGEAILAELDSKQRGYLSYILPGLEDDRAEDTDADDSARRAGIFEALTSLFSALLASRPLVLLVDDMQFADEATLLALRVLYGSDDLGILVCGTSVEPVSLPTEDRRSPLERFVNARESELGVVRHRLLPLTTADIAQHLSSVFPGLEMPSGFDDDLAQITQGNPLFLGEIIRKLVTDQKIVLTGKRWVLEAIEPDYLPQSLDEVVVEQIAALDSRNRAMLERAAMFGEDVPLSILTGGSNLDESDVLDFLDRAESLGLVKLDFQLNDETMRFLGKRVLELSYGGIDAKRRQTLHEEVGNYQESLYERRIMPSASLLAYHFKRSANQEKARRYERVSLSYTQSVFNPEEAERYGAVVDDDVDTEERLAEEALAQLPAFCRAFVTAVRNVKLYPPESAAIKQSHAEIKQSLDAILQHNELFHLSQSRSVLLANGQRLDVSGFRGPASALRELLTSTDLQGIVFNAGVSEAEIGPLLETLSSAASAPVDRGFWKRFIEEQRLEHVELHQVRYSEVRRAKAPGGGGIESKEETLDDEELDAVPRVLRAFRGATSNIKLYPVDSEQVSDSIQEVHGALQLILERRQVLNLAIIDESLLANGNRLSTSAYDSLARPFIEFMRESGLQSLTFLSTLKITELEAFFGALRELPGGADREYWDEFGKRQALTGIFFNQREYALGVVQSLLMSELADDEGAEADIVGLWAAQIEEDPAEALRQALPRFGHDLLVQGEGQLLRRLLRRLFRDVVEQDIAERAQTIHAVTRLVNELHVALQYKFAKVAADVIVDAIEREDDPAQARELATLLNLMANAALQFSDFVEVARILTALRSRHEQLAKSTDPVAAKIAQVIAPRLDAAAQELLAEDFKSDDPERRENAAEILGALGGQGAPLLIDVIKQEKDFRTRQMAARLLAGMGPEAAQLIKRSLNVEVTVEQRFRVLEVIDLVTRNLRDELAYSLGDSNPKIRRAAFRLADRLNDDSLIDVLLPFAASDDPNLVKGTIRSLAELGSEAAVQAISAALNDAREPELTTACCHALGQIGHRHGVPALKRVLARRKHVFLGHYWDDQVRATAALALRQIPDASATRALSAFANDRDPRVRQLSATAATPEGAGEGDELA